MSEPITLVQFGVGAWGRNLYRTFASLKGARLVGFHDPSDASSKAALALANVERIADVAQAFDGRAQAAIIATPAESHYDLASRALDAGLDVFVEKPMTLRASDAEDLSRRAEAAHRVLMVGHILLYHPAVERMRAMVQSGELGRLYYAYAQRINLGQVRAVEDALWSFGPHDIAVACHLLDATPIEVAAWGQSYLQPGIADVVFVNLRFPDDMLVHLHLSWLDPHRSRRMTLVGSRKMLTFDDVEPSEKLRVYDKGVDVRTDYASYCEYLTLRQGEVTIPHLASTEPLRLECQHFLDRVADRAAPRSDGASGVTVVRALEAASASLAANSGYVRIASQEPL